MKAARANKLVGLALSTWLSSVALALVLLLPSPTLGASPLYVSSAQSNAFHVIDHGHKKRVHGRKLAGSTFMDRGDSARPMYVKETPGEERMMSSMAIVNGLRGGDTTFHVSKLIDLLDIFGTAVFAFSGALKAGRKGMDIIGMMIIASITSMGGGTLRDILMMGGGEEHVVFWMKTPIYLEISLLTALLTFCTWPAIEEKFGLDADSALPICTSDALGLAAFCVVGVEAAAKRGLAPTLWVVSGLMTATFGGIIRDVICGEQPRIMYPHRTLYALGPALGALTYTMLHYLSETQSSPLLNSSSVTMVAFFVAFMVRVVSFNKPWRMPHWNIQ